VLSVAANANRTIQREEITTSEALNATPTVRAIQPVALAMLVLAAVTTSMDRATLFLSLMSRPPDEGASANNRVKIR
jgi:hypothetical protein